MSGRENGDNLETLFSFELLVECIRIEKESKVSDELAVGVRLLDFPTLLIYQPQQGSEGTNQQGPDGRNQQGEYTFNRGKSCFFKMNLSSLHTQLSNSPLYAMVLDVKEEIPKLVGTSLVSLAAVMDRIRQDVTERGASTSSSHGERGLVVMSNLMGDRIGSISLSYKLLSLGVNLLPHITDSRGLKGTGVHVEQHAQENIITELSSLRCGDVCPPTLDKSDLGIQNDKPSNEDTLINEDEPENGVCVDLQAVQKPTSRRHQLLKEAENSFEEDVTTFCPPHLFYSNSAEERRKDEGGECKLLNLDSEAHFTFEDTYSEEEFENKTEDTSSPTIHQRVRHDLNTPRNLEASRQNPNVLGEALQQLPLLNALLVELSQLNHQNPQQPLSVHPNLAWIYRPASTEHLAQKAQTKSLQKTRQGTNHLHPPRNCSTPVIRPASAKVKGKQEETSRSSSTSVRKKLVYGTTKTFNLRLKQVSPLRVKRRECVDLIDNETQSSIAKERTKASGKITKSSKRKTALNQSSSLNENVETMIQGITVESALQETITLKQKTLHGRIYGKQDRHSSRMSEKSSLSERSLKCVHIPCVDVPPNKDESKHHSESSQSQSESDRHTDKIEFSRSSRHSSPRSYFSDSSGEENEEADYADDFNSLEASDAYSPDPASSPKTSRAKTPRSPVRLDLCNSESGFQSQFQRRGVLPVPVKAPSSPQRALRGTHIIRPQTRASALSFSSDDAASSQTTCSRKQMTESGGVERSSGADSFISSRGQRSESTRNSFPVRGFSADSISSFEPQEAEELEDELRPLDFRKEYQQISKLVANKLPGYTM